MQDLLLKRNDIESQIDAYSNQKTTGNKVKGKQANSASDLTMDEVTIKVEEESSLEELSGVDSLMDVNPSVIDARQMEELDRCGCGSHIRSGSIVINSTPHGH